MSFRFIVFVLVTTFLAVAGIGQVRINELVASSSDRLFSRNSEGIAHLGAGVQWWEADYDDSFWNAGQTPIGFGYSGLNTNVESDVFPVTPTLYVRQEFTVSAADAASTEVLTLGVNYDDGFIAYLNGKEIARGNAAAPGSYLYADQASYNSRAAFSTVNFAIGPAEDWIHEGSNILSVELHNETRVSTNLHLDTELTTATRTFLASGDTCSWFAGLVCPSGGVFDHGLLNFNGPTVEWGRVDYDDSSWATGPGPLGYNTSSGAPLGTNLIGMRNNQSGLYMRTAFSLTSAELSQIQAQGLEMEVDYDDGYVAFLNGFEVSRGNIGVPGEFVPFDATTLTSHSASTDGGGQFNPEIVSVDTSALKVGLNVLSAQLHNKSLNSTDLLLHMELKTAGGAATWVAPNATYSYLPGTSELGMPSSVTTEIPEVEFSDWIELYNAGSSPVDLTGWGLSDSGDPLEWTFPAGASIAAGGYLVVIGDEQDAFNGQGSYFHTSFKLSADGETLTLADPGGSVQSSIPGGFPQQYHTHSYGWVEAMGQWRYHAIPTPGMENAPAVSGQVFIDQVDRPDFDPEGGFFDGSQTITITSNTLGAQIRYTLDGSEPTETTGMLYTTPLTVDAVDDKTGTVIRARAFAANHIPSRPRAQTYLIDQAQELQTVPALIFSADREEILYHPHGIMAIEGGTYSSNWTDTGPDSYNIALGRGRQFERPIYLEFYHADGTPGFREDVGLRLSSSGASRPRLLLDDVDRSPWSHTSRQKPSFNIFFRDDYGDPELNYDWHNAFPYRINNFEHLRIRAGKNDIRNPWIRDELVRRIYHDMGQESSVGITNSLYVNGSFKGFFNMTERLREPFMRAHHGGDLDWDVRQVNDFANGDSEVWDAMISALSEDLSVLANWQTAEAYLDPVNMADYFLLNIFCAMWDWPQNNWVGARERSPEGLFRLYVWDAERSFESDLPNNFNLLARDTIVADLFGKNDALPTLFQKLHASPEWRLTFADRIHKHMFNGGVLDDRVDSSSQIRRRAEELSVDFSPIKLFAAGGTVGLDFLSNWSDPTTGRRTYLLGPTRTDFATNSLWPSTLPVEFNAYGGDVALGFEVTMVSSNSNPIYYSLDGTDPRAPGGAISNTALTYGGPVALGGGLTTVKSRAFDPLISEWSALTEAEFNVDVRLPTSTDLVISEFMYHPVSPSNIEEAAGYEDDDEFEFIELRNTSSSYGLDLGEVNFNTGITFDFENSPIQVLDPNQSVFIVRNLPAFQLRYGNALDSRIAGEYDGKLSNGGESLTLGLGGSSPAVLHSFVYNDESPWPEISDGDGSSLLLVDPDTAPDHSLPVSWTTSEYFGGNLDGNPLNFDYARWVDHTFGEQEAADVLISGESADPDGDGFSNFFEYAFGSDPEDRLSNRCLSVVGTEVIDGTQYFTVRFERARYTLPVNLEVRVASNLTDWSTVPVSDIIPLASVVNEDSVVETWRVKVLNSTEKGFYRIRASQIP